MLEKYLPNVEELYLSRNGLSDIPHVILSDSTNDIDQESSNMNSNVDDNNINNNNQNYCNYYLFLFYR